MSEEKHHKYFFGQMPEMPWKKKKMEKTEEMEELRRQYEARPKTQTCPFHPSFESWYEHHYKSPQTKLTLSEEHAHDHLWEGVWLSPDLEGYRCIICGKEQVEIDDDEKPQEKKEPWTGY